MQRECHADVLDAWAYIAGYSVCRYTSAMNVTDDVKHDVGLRSRHDTKLLVCILMIINTTTQVRFVFALFNHFTIAPGAMDRSSISV